MDNEIKLEIKLPKVPDIELVAIEGLERLGRYLGIPDNKLGEARIIIIEAIINALEHSADGEPYINVEFSMNNDKLVVLVTDYGKGFDPAEVENPDMKEKISSDYKRGWGLKLMKSMSDDLVIESGSSGTRVSIIKNLR